MDAPPIQYVTTGDGFSIAYTATGAGRPFVFMPWPFNNVSLIWQSSFGRPLLHGLAERFRLVQYDSRGQGMSTRGLPEYFSLADYEIDLDAVIERLGLETFVLYGAPMFNHVAARYAAKHPERVEALILGDVVIDAAWGGYEEIARSDWEFYLHTIASAFSLRNAPLEVPYWRSSLAQDDCLKMIREGSKSSIRGILAEIQAPTLVLNAARLTLDAPEHRLATEGREIARLIPNAQLVLFDGFGSFLYSETSDPPPAVPAIASFLAKLPPAPARLAPILPESPTTLSAREVEVLRLVAEGKTNREIAEELVISERTVMNHLSHIFIKTGAENRAGATAYAFRHGLT
jgi:pimeloyl-ACP methyl ester carboxylesterase/DNA-binding CsgD family transcriptional regulator